MSDQPSVPQPRGMHIAHLAPHEFNHRGEPKWNVFPMIEVYGDKVVLGLASSKRYTFTAQEAFTAGRALIEASGHISHHYQGEPE